MTGQPEPHDPHLGLPPEVLADLASTDWHAGHPTVEHAEAVGGIERRCACRSDAALGAFAVRMLTGQAQMSSTLDGQTYAVVQAVHGEPVDHGPVLARMEVYGTVERVQCTCGDPEHADQDGLEVRSHGVELTGHDDLDDYA